MSPAARNGGLLLGRLRGKHLLKRGATVFLSLATRHFGYASGRTDKGQVFLEMSSIQRMRRRRQVF
eukprot:5760691-Pleurochrysis_carterae.AAC.1